MLIDDVTIMVQAGNGGNGASTFLHRSGNYKGGPDGGNGGDGGNVYIQGTTDLTALQQFQFKKIWKAEDGVAGQHKNLFGKNADDLIILVPLGTRVTEGGKPSAYEIVDTIRRLRIAKGGAGGRGNNSFKSATNQAPRYAEEGELGQTKSVRLELRLIADIGFIGLPNAGKSSLLAALTNATPKIANYPFTTLEPNLGVAEGIILADIPGLIEGASKGKGLGFQFLKHIEKTKILMHCIDITQENLLEIYNIVHKEFETYGHEINQKEEIILLTKVDLVDEKTIQSKKKQLASLKKKIEIVSVYREELIVQLKEYIKALAKN